MNREEKIARLKELRDFSLDCESYEVREDDADVFIWAIKELERTAQEVPVQEQSNNLHTLKIEDENILKLDEFHLNGVTYYNILKNSLNEPPELTVKLILNNSKIEL